LQKHCLCGAGQPFLPANDLKAAIVSLKGRAMLALGLQYLAQFFRKLRNPRRVIIAGFFETDYLVADTRGVLQRHEHRKGSHFAIAFFSALAAGRRSGNSFRSRKAGCPEKSRFID
jgi:hypothetical protein